jgi:hypothetical protein
MIVSLCRVIEDKAPAAIGAVGFARMTDRQIHHGVPQRTAPAVASDGRRLNVNDLGWLHLGRSCISKKSHGLIYRVQSAARLD